MTPSPLTSTRHAIVSRLAHGVIDHPWRVLAGWVVVLAAAIALRLVHGPVDDADAYSALGPEQPYSQALAFARQAFPATASKADAVLVYARPGGLTDADQAVIRDTVHELQNPGPPLPNEGDAVPWRIRSHLLTPYLRPRFVSDDPATGRPRAILVVISYEVPYNTEASFSQVKRILRIARDRAAGADGLALELTGSAGLGRDRALARLRDHDRIQLVVVAAVAFILLAVYRAPLAAFIPLVTIAVSAYVAIKVLRLGMSYGWPISGAELTYLVVIVFGAATDYALFWMSRYREELAKRDRRRGSGPGDAAHAPHGPADRAVLREAARHAYVATIPGILSSAGTTTLGLAALMVSLFLPMRVAGAVLALALVVSVLACLTLMPALAVLMGRRLFWPRHDQSVHDQRPRFWRRVSLLVTARPWLVLGGIAVLLAGPLVAAARVHYRFDITGETHPDSSFERGRVLAEKYFDPSILFPWTLILKLDAPPTDPAGLCRRVADALRQHGAHNVWNYADPLGQTGAISLLGRLADQEALANYYNPQQQALRFEVMSTASPFADHAIDTLAASLDAVRAQLAAAGVKAQVLATGPTAYIANVRTVADRNDLIVKAAVVLAVGLVVFLLVRDLPLTLALLGITLLAYYATLGLVGLFFVHVLGGTGVDWEIKIFSFVILMAVGQDYNLFLVSRLVEERRSRTLKPAVRHALVRTAGIISNCGLITAVALGSLCTSRLEFLRQLGFALACGTLLDTFVIRPFLLPALLTLWKRPR